MSTATRTFGAYTFNFVASNETEEAQVTLVWQDRQVFRAVFGLKRDDVDLDALVANLSDKDAVFMAANTFKDWMGACQELQGMPTELVELLTDGKLFEFPFDGDTESETAKQFFADTEELMEILRDISARLEAEQE